jgi:hypothetical protein
MQAVSASAHAVGIGWIIVPLAIVMGLATGGAAVGVVCRIVADSLRGRPGARAPAGSRTDAPTLAFAVCGIDHVCGADGACSRRSRLPIERRGSVSSAAESRPW